MKQSAIMKLVPLSVVLGILLVTACAPAATPAPVATATSAPVVTPTSAPAGTPTPAQPPGPSGSITIGVASPFFYLDPHKTIMGVDLPLHASIQETLVMFDAEGNLQPLLATTWEAVSDTEWVFHLREGVTFQNGEPFNADSVVFNCDRIMGEWGQPRHSEMEATFDHGEKIDDYTVKLVTKDPDPVFLQRLPAFFLVAPGQAEELGNENYGEHPMGTGPYKLVEYVKDDHVTLEANLDYWGELPSIETVTYKIIPEPSSRVAALMTGEVDITEIPVDSYDIVDSADNLTAVHLAAGRTPWGFFLPDSPQNPDAVALEDVRVRQAINYAVNVEGITESLFGGLTSRMASSVPSFFWGYDPSIEPYTYDPDKARELLAEAGYPEMTINVEVSTGGSMLKPQEIGQAIVSDLEQVGIHATLLPMESAALLGERDNRTAAPIFILDWGGTFPDAVWKLYYPFDSASPYAMMSDPRLDELIDESMKEMDPDARKDLLSQAQRLMHDEALALFLYAQPSLYGCNDRVVGFTPRIDGKVLAYGLSLSQ